MSVSDKLIDNDQQSSYVGRFSIDDIDLTVRIQFTGREVGNVIGKGGATIQNIRQQTGAKILISNSSTPERIVYITGNRNTICKATELIGLKVEEFFERSIGDWKGPKTPLTLKLIVPASQCGVIIGKNGIRIIEIRKSSNAAIRVGTDMLPNSTERLVSITGTTGTIAHCVYLLCTVLLTSPPCCASIPYYPSNAIARLSTYTVVKDFGSESNIPLTNLAALGLGTASNGSINPTALAALAGSQLRAGNRFIQSVGEKYNYQNSNSNIKETVEITVPNDLIGCVIGKRGTKIAEIRQISRAIVHIYKSEGTENGENVDRRITITGNKESISVAKYLIEMSVELQKANLADVKSSTSSDNGSISTSPSPTMNQLFAKPDPITTIASLYAYIAFSSAKQSPPIQTTGVHRPKNCLKRKRSPSSERTQSRKD